MPVLAITSDAILALGAYLRWAVGPVAMSYELGGAVSQIRSRLRSALRRRPSRNGSGRSAAAD